VPGAFAISRRPWESVYSLAPLRARLEASISLARLRVPLACGVVVGDTREYRNLSSTDMTEDEQLYTAILASGSIAGLMPAMVLHDHRGPSILYDGGHRHCLPPIPVSLEPHVTHIDAVLCAPLEREKVQHRHGLAHSVAWAFESVAELSKRLDLDYLRALSKDRNVSVRVYAPTHTLGGLLDGHRKHLRRRIELGEAAIENPLVL
jgi:hypothetical protein